MDERSIAAQRFVWRRNRLEFGVFDFDEVADFFERIGVFRSDEGNDVSDVFRHFAFADHDIPVLFNVANFVVGNVFSGQDFDAIGVLESL